MADEAQGGQVESKAALRKSIECFVPREMDRKVTVTVGTLRAAFGKDAAGLIRPNMVEGQLVEVTVRKIHELSG